MKFNIAAIMLSNTSDDQYYLMTENALTSMHKNKGSADNCIKCVVVETNKNAKKHNQDLSDTITPDDSVFNYNKYINYGYKHIIENYGNDIEYVCILNNDLIFHENWLINLISGLEDNNLDSVSPLSPGWFKHNDINEEWRVHRGWDIGLHFCGWCLLFKKESYDKLNPLDERFLFWCQDDDLAKTMDKLNMSHALISTARVTHLVSRSHNLIPPGMHNEFTHGMGIILNQKINEGGYER